MFDCSTTLFSREPTGRKGLLPVAGREAYLFLPNGIVPAVRGWFESLRNGRPPAAAAVLTGAGAAERKAD